MTKQDQICNWVVYKVVMVLYYTKFWLQLEQMVYQVYHLKIVPMTHLMEFRLMACVTVVIAVATAGMAGVACSDGSDGFVIV